MISNTFYIPWDIAKQEIALQADVIDTHASNVEKLCDLDMQNGLLKGITVDVGALDFLYHLVLVEVDGNEMTMVDI